MRKFISIVVLLVVIILTFGFVILRSLANGPENDFFNAKYRGKFAQSEFFRDVLFLHSDGDGKSDYLGPKYGKIAIEVDEMTGFQIPSASLDLLVSRIAAVTGKQVSYFYSDQNIPYAGNLTQPDIEKIALQYRNSGNASDTASLYLLIASNLSENPDQIGSTFRESGIVIFGATLDKYTQGKDNLKSNYLESTALHEFGHQLGLDHNAYNDCLMQAVVESYSGIYQAPGSVVTDFCNYEKDQIAEEKAKL